MSSVKLYIYDLSKGLAKTLSYQILGQHLDGIWHTGIVVYGQEFFYGSSGISECPPGGTILGAPTKIEDLGITAIPEDLFRTYLFEQSVGDYRGDKYQLFDHNCNNFSDDAAYFLTSRHIPSYITSLPGQVVGTPLGQMMRSILDQMQVSPSSPVTPFLLPKAEQERLDKQKKTKQNKASNSKHLDDNHSSSVSASRTEILVRFDERLLPEVAEFSYEENECKHLEASLRDIFEYVTSTQTLSWGLGPVHFQLIGEITGTGTPLELHILELFRVALILNTDVAVGLARDRARHWQKLLSRMSSHIDAPSSLHNAVMKVVCNWIVQLAKLGEVARSSEETKLIAQYCASLLTGHTSQHRCAAAVASNLASLQVLEEEELIGLSSILIHNLITRDPSDRDTTTHQHAVKALAHFTEISQEIRDLAIVQGLDVSDIDGADSHRLQLRLKS